MMPASSAVEMSEVFRKRFDSHGTSCRAVELIDSLFEWIKTAKDHLLIRSCVFHYEFEFIHPFSDGNGRTGRLWQSLILGQLHPLFEHLPVENMVYANQEDYNAIQTSTKLQTRTFH